MEICKHRRKIWILMAIICLVAFVLLIFPSELKNAKNTMLLKLEMRMIENEFDRPHNDIHYDCEHMDLFTSHPKPSIVASFGLGRTGSQLGFFAAGYALWKDFGILNFISRQQLDILPNTFVLQEQREMLNNSTYYIWLEGMSNF